MKRYATYLTYQVARFGALNVPRMLTLCEGKCKRSALYRTVSELRKDKMLSWIINPMTRSEGYHASKEALEFLYGPNHQAVTSIRGCDLEHTFHCVDALLNLARYKNVTGICSSFELTPHDSELFCHGRTPDGIFRLTQEGQHFELALEVERTLKDKSRIQQILDSYWQTFKMGMPCTGLLIVATDKGTFNAYTDAVAKMPPEFQSRVRIVLGTDLTDLPSEAYGQRTKDIFRCVDLTRTSFHGEISYSPIKSHIYLSHSDPITPDLQGVSQNAS